MRNIHVPAYWPSLAGIQLMEYSGVSVAVKNVMAMSLIPIIESLEDDDVDIDIEELVELAIAMPAVVVAAIVELDIDISIVGCFAVQRM